MDTGIDIVVSLAIATIAVMALFVHTTRAERDLQKTVKDMQASSIPPPRSCTSIESFAPRSIVHMTRW